MKKVMVTEGCRRLARQLTFWLCLLIVLLTTVAVSFAQQRISTRSADAFSQDANDANERFKRSLQQYADLLYQGRSFVHGSREVTQKEWEQYFREQNIFGRYKGISMVFIAETVPHDAKLKFEAAMRMQPQSGADYSISPGGDRPEYLMITRYLRATNVAPAINFDLYSTPARRQTYAAARVLNHPVASPPLVLASGEPGFFMTLPVDTSGKSFVVITFHTDQLLDALFEGNTLHKLALRISETDMVDPNEKIELFKTANWHDSNEMTLRRTDTFGVAGRQWIMEYKGNADYDNEPAGRFGTLFIGLIGSMLIVMIGLTYFALLKVGERNVALQKKTGSKPRKSGGRA
ncbi:CHASE domain-containing protein [Candidatus Saccharibacteria bacterium]|nr:CHASE domain-containing protein [Candidatus Saccharibacteria bacterium]